MSLLAACLRDRGKLKSYAAAEACCASAGKAAGMLLCPAADDRSVVCSQLPECSRSAFLAIRVCIVQSCADQGMPCSDYSPALYFPRTCGPPWRLVWSSCASADMASISITLQDEDLCHAVPTCMQKML